MPLLLFVTLTLAAPAACAGVVAVMAAAAIENVIDLVLESLKRQYRS